MEYQERAVAFIDILGWKQVITDSVTDVDLRARMEEALTGLGSIVRQRAEEEDDPRIISQGFPPSDDQASQFSDSVIISYLFHTPHDLTRLIRELTSYQSMMLCLGFPLRGGVTVGRMYHRGPVAFGPALNAAVALEKECAMFPRVVIDIALNSHIEKASKQFPSHWTFVRQDDDGFFRTDYLTQLALSPTSATLAKSFIDKQLSRFAGDNRILPKYRWLSEKLAQAIIDASWRRDIHDRLHDTMQST